MACSAASALRRLQTLVKHRFLGALRLTATQRGLPEYGLLIESMMTGDAERERAGGASSRVTAHRGQTFVQLRRRGVMCEDSVLADAARRRSSLSKIGIRMENLLERTPLGRG